MDSVHIAHAQYLKGDKVTETKPVEKPKSVDYVTESGIIIYKK